MTTTTNANYTGKPTLGRYVLLREIARSNDVVYEAVDPHMNRRLALKELSLAPTLTGQARRERIERFFREARAAGAMNHPNIVTIHEVGEDHGRFFIAMEFLEGQTLRERLSVVGALPLHEAVGITASLCDALEYAHAQGVVHRDIKPDNIHILPGGQVKLTDFGIARILHETQLTVAGQVFGTPSYMSPEQVMGAPIDARTDLFSLGILLFEMLTGRKPFTGDSVVTITYKIMNDPTPPAIGVPAEVEAVLQRVLSKSSEGRYRTATEFRTALVQAVALVRSGAYRPNAPDPLSAPTVAGTPIFANNPPTISPQMQTQAFVSGTGAPLPSPAMQNGAVPFVPLTENHYREPARRPIGAIVTALVLMLGLLGGAVWAVSAAFKNHEREGIHARYEALYAQASKLYDKADYENAAKAFAVIRTGVGVTAETLDKAIKGEVYCYRMLGQKAQAKSDYAAAEEWFNKAVSLAPTDEQAMKELVAVQKIRGTFGTNPLPTVASNTTGTGTGTIAPQTTSNSTNTSTPPGPSGTGPLAAAGLLPTPSPAATPAPGQLNSPSGLNPAQSPVLPGQQTTQGLNQSNQNKAQQAQDFYTKGEQAWASGDKDGALRLWNAAVAAGPGSQAAVQAQARILQYGDGDPLSN